MIRTAALPEAAQRTPLDELFDQVRETLAAEHQAGYQSGRYTSNNPHQDVDDYLQAVAKRDELVTALWRKLHDLAPAFADAVQVLEVARGLDSQEG